MANQTLPVSKNIISKYLSEENEGSVDDDNSPYKSLPSISSKVRVKYSYTDKSEGSNSSIASINSAVYTSNDYLARQSRIDARRPPPSSDGIVKESFEPVAKVSMAKLSKSMDAVRIDANEKRLTMGNEARQIEKIFEDALDTKILREVSDRLITINYIDCFQGLKLIKSLATNTVCPMLLNLINKKLDRFEKDYFVENSFSRLRSISESSRFSFLTGIRTFKSTIAGANGPTVNVEFMDSVMIEILEVIAKSLLGKFINAKLKKKDSSPTPTKSDELTANTLIKVLDSEVGFEKMIEILAKQHCLENLFYYQKQKEACTFALIATSTVQIQSLDTLVRQISREFIASGAPLELNIPSKLRITFMDAIKQRRAPVSILEPITQEVLKMILQNSFPTYMKYYK